MNYWKPIVASLVIFISGLVSGVIVTKSLVTGPAVEPVVERGPRPWENRWFLERLQRELDLTPSQRTEIESLLVTSQENIRDLFEPVREQASQINVKLREDMRAVLTPEQVEEYDRLMSRPPRRGGGPPRGGGRGPDDGRDNFRDRDGNRGDFRNRDGGRRDPREDSDDRRRQDLESADASEESSEVN